jgi:hypothetical protein
MSLASHLSGERQLLGAGRALEDALGVEDRFQVELAAQELLRVGQARENSIGSVAGFRSEEIEAEAGAEADPDAALDQILSELEIGRTLVAAGAAVKGSEAAPFSAALDQLEADRQRRVTGVPAEGRFKSGTAATGDPLDAFRACLDEFIDDVVSRTNAVGVQAIKGLTTIPGSVVQPWVGVVTSLGQIPAVSALTALGLRAVRRAVGALQRLIPEPLREFAVETARKWWDASGAEAVSRRILAVDELKQRASVVLAGTLDDGRLREGIDALDQLDSRHGKTTDTIKRILGVLGSLLGPLVATFTAAAAWLYAAAAAGFFAAVAGAVWIGRDFFDTGAGWERVDGAQRILAGLAR